MKKIVRISMVMFAMSGCSLAPQYQRPALPIPSDWNGSVMENGLGTHLPDGQFAFTSLTPDEIAFLSAFSHGNELPRLVEQTLHHNPDLELAALRVDQARLLYHSQEAQSEPAVDLVMQQEHRQFHDADLNARYGQNLSTAGIGFSGYELDFFGRVRNLTEASRHQYLAVRYAQQAGRIALMAEIAGTYIDRLAACHIQNTMQEIFQDQQAILDVSTLQQRIGIISEQELQDQKNITELARQHWLEAQGEQVKLTHALQLLGGYASIDLPSVKELPDMMPDASLNKEQFENQSSAILLNRPDILQAEEKLKAANADIGAARAAFFPSIQLSSSIGTASTSLQGLFSDGTGAWTFSPQIVLPIFSGGRIQDNLDSAKNQKNTAVIEYQKAVQSAFREIADVLYEHKTQMERVAFGVKKLSNEQKIVQLASAHAEAGWIDKTSFLVAKIKFKQEQLSHIQDEHALARNWLMLYYAFYAGGNVS